MSLAGLLSTQRGVVARWQALRCGVTPATIRAHLAVGRWQTVFRGVYATFSGPLPRPALLWAVVLRAGPGAALSHRTAAELVGLLDGAARPIHVTVPTSRRVFRLPGVRVHHADRSVHPSRLPPQTRVEETVLDLSQAATLPADAVALVTAACGRRLTTPQRIRAAIDRRPRMRWRAALREACEAADEGCHSVLEARYLWRVERAHGLPVAERQHRVHTGHGSAAHGSNSHGSTAHGSTAHGSAGHGSVLYEDVWYAEYGVVVELDGAAHVEPSACAQDLRRDNATTARGLLVLRYDWAAVTFRSCEVAAEVATVLRTRGWRGAPVNCSRCTPAPV